MTVHIGTEHRLFIDDHVIGNLTYARKSLQRPEKLAEPVRRGTEPWENSTASIIGNPLRWDGEDQCFKAWDDTKGGIAYPTSADGLSWEKPNLGIVEVDGSTPNNLILPGRNLSVIVDDRETDPARRYKRMYRHSRRDPEMPWNGKGHFVPFSADGIPWEDYADNPVTGFGNALTDGQDVLGWDELTPGTSPTCDPVCAASTRRAA